MKRILVVSELFFPNNKVGALRPSKICKRLLEKGYKVDVITAYKSEGIYNSDNCRVFNIKGDKLPEAKAGASSSLGARGWFISQLRFLKRTLTSYKNGYEYCKKVMTLFENGTLSASDYDACFTTYGPKSSVLIGLKLKKKYKIKNWICDFRDPLTVYTTSVFLYPFCRYLQNKACKYADSIVSVSNGYIKRICKKKYLHKSYMIPNGYDTGDIKTNKNETKNQKLTFCYVGALYEGERDLSALFSVVRELIDEEKIDGGKISFEYAGSDFSVLQKQAEKYRMSFCLNDNGRLPRSECLRLQQESDILLLSTWNTKNESGVFPGKFLEYMLIGKPIVSVTTGNIANGEVTSVLREGKLGIAYEAANNSQDYLLMKEYIKNQYNNFLNSGKVEFSPDREIIDRYNWDNLIGRIEKLL